MDELITISDQRTVSARELYEKLGFDKTHWSRWEKQNIKDNRFAIQGQDYDGFAIMANGNQTQDYQLSIDFAKRLCMMARTEKGEKIRNYFIEVEKRYQSMALSQEIFPLLHKILNNQQEFNQRLSVMERRMDLDELGLIAPGQPLPAIQETPVKTYSKTGREYPPIKILQLPDHIRDVVDRMLWEDRTLRETQAYLDEMGYHISVKSVHRYSQALRQYQPHESPDMISSGEVSRIKGDFAPVGF